jgi:hypothetical protein
VYHSHPLTLRAFLRQHFNYGRGAFRFHQARARQGLEPIGVEPLSFYLNLLCYPFSQPQRERAVSLAALTLLSQAATAAGFFWERGLNRKNSREGVRSCNTESLWNDSQDRESPRHQHP